MLDRVAFGDRPANARSKVTNGVRLFLKGTTDGRSRESRRFHDLCAAYAKEFGTTHGLNEARENGGPQRCGAVAAKRAIAGGPRQRPRRRR